MTFVFVPLPFANAVRFVADKLEDEPMMMLVRFPPALEANATLVSVFSSAATFVSDFLGATRVVVAEIALVSAATVLVFRGAGFLGQGGIRSPAFPGEALVPPVAALDTLVPAAFVLAPTLAQRECAHP